MCSSDLVIAAITTGRRASYSIDEYLSGTPAPDLSLEKGHVKRSATCLDHSEAVKANLRPVAELSADKEDDLGLPFEAVRKEADRCLNCACYAVTPSDTETMLMALKAKVVTSLREYSADEFFTRYTKVQDMLAPGEIVPVEIALWPTSVRFHAGEALQVLIQSYDDMGPEGYGFPTECGTNHGRHIIHTGGRYDSKIYLPVIPRR